jgi:hypothetical protein
VDGCAAGAVVDASEEALMEQLAVVRGRVLEEVARSGRDRTEAVLFRRTV